MTIDAAIAAEMPRFHAAVEMLRRTGLVEFQLRYSDDEQPVAWIALGAWEHDGERRHEAAGALDPLRAVFRLCDAVIDGGHCTHCARPTGFHPDPDEMPAAEWICWYVYDPELETFRRGCEGDAP